MALGSKVSMDNVAPPNDLVTLTEGTQKTSLTWAQINYAVNKRFVRNWRLGLKKVRYVSLAELRAYEQEMTTFRPAWESADEESGEE